MQTIDNLEDLVPLLAGITKLGPFCKVILDNVPAKLKTPLGRAARDFYGHPWPDKSLATGLSPSMHNGSAKAAGVAWFAIPENKERLRVNSTARNRANRLEGLIGSCKKAQADAGTISPRLTLSICATFGLMPWQAILRGQI